MHNKNNHEIMRYIEEHGVFHKDSQEESRKPSKKPKTQKRTPQPHSASRSPRKIIDLHGKNREQAAMLVGNAIRACVRENAPSLLIIHGKGKNSDPSDGPVLRDLVRSLLASEFAHIVKDFTYALPRDGGEGATVVFLDLSVGKTR